MQVYSFSQVKNSFDSTADRSSIISRYVFRPVSFYLAYIVLIFNVTPNTATFFSFLFGLISIVLLAMGGRLFSILGVLFYFLYIVFDFIDGNIARVKNHATYYGKFLDGAVDAFIESLLPFCFSLSFFIYRQSLMVLFLGMGTSLLLLYAYLLLTRVSFFSRWIAIEEGDKIKQMQFNKNPLDSGNVIRIKTVGNIMFDLTIVVLLLVLIVGIHKILIIIFLLLNLLYALFLIILMLRNASKNFRIHRISKMARGYK